MKTPPRLTYPTAERQPNTLTKDSEGAHFAEGSDPERRSTAEAQTREEEGAKKKQH
jgi:hypothetical protein